MLLVRSFRLGILSTVCRNYKNAKFPAKCSTKYIFTFLRAPRRFVWLSICSQTNSKFPLKRPTKRICTFSRASPGSVRCSFCSKTKLKLLHDRFNSCQGKPYWSHSKAHARITFGANSNIFRKIIYVNRKFIHVKMPHER